MEEVGGVVAVVVEEEQAEKGKRLRPWSAQGGEGKCVSTQQAREKRLK